MTHTVTFGEFVDSASAVLVDGEPIGSIRELTGNTFRWTISEQGTARGFVIPVLFSMLHVEVLHHTLEMVISRQMVKLAVGKPLSAADRNPLHPELQLYLSDGAVGQYLRHPLVYNIPHTSLMAAHCNFRLKMKMQERDAALAAQKWGDFVLIHEQAYHVGAFLTIIDRLADAEYWAMLSDLWQMSDNIYQNRAIWNKLWHSPRENRQEVMNEADHAAFAALPETLTIYRGYRHRTSKTGLSWSLDRDKAVWFANRFRHDGQVAYLATATVAKTDVMAHFIGRNELEIVVVSNKLRNVRVERC